MKANDRFKNYGVLREPLDAPTAPTPRPSLAEARIALTRIREFHQVEGEPPALTAAMATLSAYLERE